ncbi:MAG: GTP cyclohydrolase II, partial [Pseudomonadota bacterium]
MSLVPDITEMMARARADLRMGLPVVLCDQRSAVLAAAAETLTADRMADLRALSDQAVLAITARRAETLKARAYDGDVARVILPGDASLGWLQAVSDPTDDLQNPMKGPMVSARDGSADLHRLAIALAKSARLLPAVLVVPVADGPVAAEDYQLTRIDFEEARAHLGERSPLHQVVHARLPISAAEAGRLHIYRPEDGGEEHYAIEIGRPDRAKPVLARLHSACFTGDVLGSLKCDCGPQLH